MMNIWEFQARLSQRLLIWAGVSSAFGVVFSFFGKFGRGLGGQFIGWGLVNAAIAAVGSFFTDQRRLTLAQPDSPAVLMEEGDKLQRLLWINAGLDVLYMLFGVLLMRRKSAQGRGTGLGIILQGLFLFVFDIFHAVRVPTWPWGGSDPR